MYVFVRSRLFMTFNDFYVIKRFCKLTSQYNLFFGTQVITIYENYCTLKSEHLTFLSLLLFYYYYEWRKTE